MFKLKPYFRLIFLVTLLFLIASCSPQTTPDASEVETGSMEHEDDDHDEHGDEDDHGDEDHDEHGDEDGHDDEHGDEDHDDEHREHGAHEHGTAELTVALVGSQAEISLETPAFNLVGFEYAPKSDEEKAAVDGATANLEKGDWFTLSEAAGCTLSSFEVESTMSEEGHEGEDHDDEDHSDEEDHDDEDEDHDEHGDEDHKDEGETHSSFFANYTFDCSSPEELASLDATALFNNFPNFEDVDAE